VNHHADWLSQKEEEWFTSAEIASSRKGIADVYTKGDPVRSIKDAEVSVLENHIEFSGEPKVPKVEVRLGAELLNPLSDYTLEFSNNVNVGAACVDVMGKGSYVDTASAMFEILPASISSASITGLETKVYTGVAQTQVPTVRLGTKYLNAENDYTVDYGNNINSGTATLTVAGRGNYSGLVKATFKIKRASIARASISGVPSQTYTGQALKPLPIVKLAGKKLRKDVDYKVSYKNNVKVGKASAVVTGIGNYAGTATIPFRICLPISKVSVANISSRVYSGKAIKPSLKLAYKGKTLKKGTDYTAIYTENVNAGTAKVTIKGKGSFNGTKIVKFKINKASLSKAKIGDIAKQAYTGAAIRPKLVISLGGKRLMEGVDYILVYSNNKSVGTAKVTVKGRGNHSGTRTVSFKIVRN
jgi:hypothetical protein